MYKTIIFDLDGTLLDTLDDLTDAVNVVLDAGGYPRRSRGEVRSYLGNGLRRLAALALPPEADAETAAHTYVALKDYYVNHCQIKTGPYPGIPALLRALRDHGCKLAIVSNKADPAVQTLTDFHFRDCIHMAVGERADIRKKPAPDAVLAVLDRFGTEKAEALYVGDSEVDAETAGRAGIDCVLVDWGFRDREVLLQLAARAVISRPAELLSLCGVQEL